MSDQDLMAGRLKEQARKMRSLFDELDRLDVSAPENGSDAFKLPYTTGPKKRMEGFKLTFPA